MIVIVVDQPCFVELTYPGKAMRTCSPHICVLLPNHLQVRKYG